jgi:RNA polymerase sigma-70 factor (ECF subfamily)
MRGSDPAEDRAARFESLYRATRTDVLAYLLRRTAEREEAADLLGEVYLTAWRRLDDVPPGNEARLWLFGVARNTLANAGRKAASRRIVVERLRDELRAIGVPRAVDRTDARIVALHEALGSLGPDARELLTLTAWEALTPAEIARMTGETAGSVRVQLHRARGQLRARLERLGVVNDELPV